MAAFGSFVRHYGILSASIIPMTLFGTFGVKPSQMRHKCAAYLINIWFVLCYITVCAVGGIQFLVTLVYMGESPDLIDQMYSLSYAIIAGILYTVWVYLVYKEYNLYCLLEEILSIRRNKLSKKEKCCIGILITVFVALFVLINYVMGTMVNSDWSSGVALNVFFIVVLTVYSNISYMLVWNITLLLCFITLVLSSEFQHCVSGLKISLVAGGRPSFCKESFYRTAERFRELTEVVNQVGSFVSKIIYSNYTS